MLNIVGSRVGGDVLLDICRVCFGRGKPWQGESDHTTWDFNCLGTYCYGAGLLRWSHLWCSFQSCCHSCSCFHQKISTEAGESWVLISELITPFSLCCAWLILLHLQKNHPMKFPYFIYGVGTSLCDSSGCWINTC